MYHSDNGTNLSSIWYKCKFRHRTDKFQIFNTCGTNKFDFLVQRKFELKLLLELSGQTCAIVYRHVPPKLQNRRNLTCVVKPCYVRTYRYKMNLEASVSSSRLSVHLDWRSGLVTGHVRQYFSTGGGKRLRKQSPSIPTPWQQREAAAGTRWDHYYCV